MYSKHFQYSLLLVLLFFTNRIYSQINDINKIDSLMKWSSKNELFNGNIIVTKNNKIIYNSSFGFVDANKTKELTTDYTFNIGSITKEFSAIALEQLKEEGKLQLDDKVSKFFPELPKWSNEVSIRDLLYYTSGIPNVNWKKIKSNKDIFEDLKQIDSLDFIPGTKYDYNNNNIFLRQFIIEKITGEDYKNYVNKYIFKPCKMNSSEITPIDENKKYVAKGFNNNLVEDKPDFLVGGTFLTTNDLLKFTNCLHSKKLINKNSLFELGQQFNEDDSQSALGEAKYRNKNLIEHVHDGRAGNYEAIMISNIDEKFTVILLGNNYKGKIFELSDAIIAILKNQEYSLPKKDIK